MKEALKEMLIQHEAEVNHAYQDSEGFWTIGVGRLIDKRKGGGISHDESMYLLDNDISRTLDECSHSFDWYDDLDEVRQIVVANMVFNMGLPTFKKFKKTIAFIETGHYHAASVEMLNSRWAKQVGYRAQELSSMMAHSGMR